MENHVIIFKVFLMNYKTRLQKRNSLRQVYDHTIIKHISYIFAHTFEKQIPYFYRQCQIAMEMYKKKNNYIILL